MGSRYEISPREREDIERYDGYDWNEPEETYWDYLARLAERPKAGSERDRSSGAAQPGTGRSANRDKEAA